MTCKFVKGQTYAYRKSPNNKVWEFVGFTENNALALFCDTGIMGAEIRRIDGTCSNRRNSDYDIISDEMTDKEKATLIKLLDVTGYGTTARDVLNGYVRAMPKLMLDILRETYGRKE